MVWPDLNIVDVDEDLVRYAGRLAERHALRGYDAVQLAAAYKSGCDAFVGADIRLNAAAKRLRLKVVDLKLPQLTAARPPRRSVAYMPR